MFHARVFTIVLKHCYKNPSNTPQGSISLIDTQPWVLMTAFTIISLQMLFIKGLTFTMWPTFVHLHWSGQMHSKDPDPHYIPDSSSMYGWVIDPSAPQVIVHIGGARCCTYRLRANNDVAFLLGAEGPHSRTDDSVLRNSSHHVSLSVVFKDTQKPDEYRQNRLEMKSTWMYLVRENFCFLMLHLDFCRFLETQHI